MRFNDAGNFFGVHGICLGMELMLKAVSQVGLTLIDPQPLGSNLLFAVPSFLDFQYRIACPVLGLGKN
jgi:hypothetical protein